MPTLPQSRFYVYVLARSTNGKPFYVGKGAGRRVFRHDTEARRGCDCFKCRTIRKIWREGGQVLRYIIFTTDDEAEAFAYERETIALYGRENLCNLSDGGEGPSGAAVSPELRARRREQSKAAWSDPSLRAKARANTNARYADPDERAKTGAKAKAYYARNPEALKQKGLAVKAALSNPEKRAKLSASQKARWADPELRAAAIASQKAAQSTTEARARNSASMKALWSSPEYRERITAARKAARVRRKADQELERE